VKPDGLLKKKFVYDKKTFAFAAKNRNIEIMKRFLENNFSHDKRVYQYSMEHGYFENINDYWKINLNMIKKQKIN
jgi:hypothetical protein